jgi:hypothetical protein
MPNSSQVESIFFAALEKKAGAERSAYLEQACGGDSALRLRVEQLLDAHPQAEDFLARPAVDRQAFNLRRQKGDIPFRPFSALKRYIRALKKLKSILAAMPGGREGP